MNPVVHFEIPYENAARAAKFYASAFGWKTQLLGEDMGNYVLVTTAESDVKPGAPAGAINGGLFPKQANGAGQHPSLVIGVQDIHAWMQKVKQAGGEVLGEPMEIPGVGRYVSFLDTEGNRNSMLEPTADM
jgi:predicted enzyme related to lactoylglutathione lyase